MAEALGVANWLEWQAKWASQVGAAYVAPRQGDDPWTLVASTDAWTEVAEAVVAGARSKAASSRSRAPSWRSRSR